VSTVKVCKDVYWVGVVDWDIRHFHGHTYSTKRGTTYNAYLILDEKITLVDAVYEPFTQEFVNNIKEIIPPEKIDNIIVNHVERDHSGALPHLVKLCPNAKLFGTAKCKEGLEAHYHGGWDFNVVKTGDKLKLGKKTLTFVEAPMLHWPDSMFSYLIEEELLLPNDGFGQHYATSKRFDDEVDSCELMDEAAKYYGNILWPLSGLVLKKLEEVQNLDIPIKMIAPSHGVIWRKDPAKIIDMYLNWAKNQTQSKAVIVYETMWGSTEKMARSIADGLTDSGISVNLFDINKSDKSEIIKEMLNAKGFIIGSSTHDNGMLSNLAGFLEFLKGLRPKNRIAAAFGSYGWGGGAVRDIENILKATGVELATPSVSVKYVPDEKSIKRCSNFGRDFAKQIKEKDKIHGKV